MHKRIRKLRKVHTERLKDFYGENFSRKKQMTVNLGERLGSKVNVYTGLHAKLYNHASASSR